MKIEIKGEYITIGQLIKKENFITTGGEIKHFLENNRVIINGNKPQGRSSKVRPGDTVWIRDRLFTITAK